MRTRALSRRRLLEAGACAVAAVSGIPEIARARTVTGLSPRNDETIRKYYAAWQEKDWRPFDILLADNFTFTSANNDDHISKSAFKTRCWESQIDFVERFELQRVIGINDDAFVMYVCRTKTAKTFRNVEYFRLREGKVEAIESYFGAKSSFASAVASGQR
jgi:ketosteroid isomerase-like protein